MKNSLLGMGVILLVFIVYFASTHFFAEQTAIVEDIGNNENDCIDFCDISNALGISDELRYGKSIAFADVNSDGWDDFWISDADIRFRETYGVSKLFLNREGKRFEELDPRDLGISDENLLINWSASFADFDNDGDPDLMLSNGGWEKGVFSFYRNDFLSSGTFVDITEEAGFGSDQEEWMGSSWSDYDNDGFLDVVVMVRVGSPRLYHNNGDGTFTEESKKLGVNAVFENGKNPLWIDYDLDGDEDLLLVGFGENDVYFYRNDGIFFTLINESLVLRTELSDDVLLGHVFSTVAEDFNLDGYPDLYFGRDDYQDFLFINQKNGEFWGYGKEIGLDMKIGENRGENSMSVWAGDINDSGYPDVLIGTGNTNPYQDILLCLEKSDETEAGIIFSHCSEPVVVGHGGASTHGIMLNDFDLDGDADVFYNLGGSAWYDRREGADSRRRVVVYERKRDSEVNTAIVKLQGTKSNRDAIGARISVGGSQKQYYWVRSSQGFVSQPGSWIDVRLGDVESADLTINWPSGITSTTTVRSGDKKIIIEPES